MLLSPPRMLSELAETARETIVSRFGLLGGADLAPEIKVGGDPTTLVKAVCSVEAIEPGGLTFATDRKYLDKALSSDAAAVIIPPDLESAPIPYIQSPEPRMIFSIILELTGEPPRPVQAGAGGIVFKDRSRVEIGENSVIGDFCYIGADVEIGRDCLIFPHVFIDDQVRLGDGCMVYPRVTIFRRTQLGNRVILHTGATIGDDGFSYNQVMDIDRGRLLHIKNAHAGGVVIEDDVEIGAGVCVDRGLVTDTVIGAGTKIDNLVQIAHNVQLGRDCIVLSQVGIAGSSRLGDRVFALGQVGVANGLTIGDDAIITSKSGVSTNIPSGRTAWAGIPVQKADAEWKIKALSRRELPRFRDFWRIFKKAGSFEELKAQFFSPEKSGKREER